MAPFAFRVALLCALVALVHAGCTKKDACPAGQCCGGAVVLGKCVGIGCTCFCPATSGDFKCMIDSSKYLASKQNDLAKCGKNSATTLQLAKNCATADIGACGRLAKQMVGIGRKMA